MDNKSEESMKTFFPSFTHKNLHYATVGKLILQDIKKKSKATGTIINYSKEDVIRFIESPERNEKALRDISRKLYNVSPHYKRAVNYFSKLLRFDYIIEPYGINADKVKTETIKNQYLKVCDFLDLMNIKHEFGKILNTAFKEDAFFGYEHMTKESYFIQKLNADYCRISSIEDGVYNFAFDFSFFDKFPEQLDMYASEFKGKYKKYKKNQELKFQELDSNRTICIKINEESETLIPPMAGVFESIYELNDYKKLRKVTKQMGAYKLLTMKVPMKTKEEEVNGFLVDYDTMMEFHNRSAQSVPEEIGVITVPFDVKAVDFSNNVKDENTVADAENEVWNNFTISQLLFNTDKSSSIGLSKSITADEQMVFAVLRQIERWINRRLRFEFKAIKFRVNMLNTTIYNWQEVFEKLKEAGSLGMPSKMIACASLGMSPSSVINMTFLENEVLGLHDKFIPLSSSYTQSGDGDTTSSGGRPSNGDDISEEGLKTRDEDKNDLRE